MRTAEVAGSVAALALAIGHAWVSFPGARGNEIGERKPGHIQQVLAEWSPPVWPDAEDFWHLASASAAPLSGDSQVSTQPDSPMVNLLAVGTLRDRQGVVRFRVGEKDGDEYRYVTATVGDTVAGFTINRIGVRSIDLSCGNEMIHVPLFRTQSARCQQGTLKETP